MGAVSNQKEISYSDIKTRVKRRLAIIGKRLQDKQGNILFAGTTLSTNEEAILKEYIDESAHVFFGNFTDNINYYTVREDNFLVIFSGNRINETPHLEEFASNFIDYIVAYVANAVLAMNYPDQAKKYEVDMQNHLQAATKLIYTKNAPTASEHTLGDMTGEVKLENKPVAL